MTRATKQKSRTIISGIIVVSLLLLSTGCSWAGKEKTTKPPDSTATDGNVRGRVWHKSDVGGEPDAPARALVLALRPEHLDQLRSEIGARHFGFSLSEQLFARFVESEATSDTTGAYSLQVQAGGYWLCLANVDQVPREKKFPVFVSGCILVSIPEGTALEQNISIGEGGVRQY